MHSTTYEYPICRASHRLERLATIPAVALRFYIASVWFRFALLKFQTGWLTTNPLRPLLTSVGAGQIPTTAPGYAFLARMMVASHADVLLSVLIPCMELAVAVAFVFGVAPRITAL